MTTEHKPTLAERASLWRADALDWCQGRLWPPRALLLLWVAYAVVRHLKDPMYESIIGPLNFGIHELGHFVFRPFGEFVSICGGSLFQCLVPFIGLAMFLRQRDYFAAAFSFGWLSTNLFYVATYCSDARSMQIPLLSPGGGDAYHDWNYILDRMGLLRFDHALAFLMRGAAALSALVFLVVGSWLLWHMARGEKDRSSPTVP
ncbi:hypothetical protein HY251_19640 [bacterium]|nr:hypothetical protein [bacterium]